MANWLVEACAGKGLCQPLEIGIRMGPSSMASLTIHWLPILIAEGDESLMDELLLFSSATAASNSFIQSKFISSFIVKCMSWALWRSGNLWGKPAKCNFAGLMVLPWSISVPSMPMSKLPYAGAIRRLSGIPMRSPEFSSSVKPFTGGYSVLKPLWSILEPTEDPKLE